MSKLIHKKWFKVLSVLCWILMIGSIYLATNNLLIAIEIIVIPLIHELGHAIPGVLLFKVPAKLVILPFGLAVDFDEKQYSQLPAEKAALILIGGVSINTIMGAGFFILLRAGSTDFAVFFGLILNVLLALTNSIPLSFVDGSHFVKAVLWPMRQASRALFVAIWLMSLALVWIALGMTTITGIVILANALGVCYYALFANRSKTEQPNMFELICSALAFSGLLFCNLFMGMWILQIAQVI